MGRSPTSETGSTHERVAMPSTCTVHAPQALMPQPYLVPVIFNSSRRTQSSGVEGSTLTSLRCPLTVKLIASPSLISYLQFRRTRRAGINPAPGAATNSACDSGGKGRCCRRDAARASRPRAPAPPPRGVSAGQPIHVVVLRAVGDRAAERSTREGRSLLSCHVIERGARCQLWPPGTPVLSAFAS